MDDNSLLVIVLAFVVGYMASGMMKQMCGGRLVEGDSNFCQITDGAIDYINQTFPKSITDKSITKYTNLCSSHKKRDDCHNTEHVYYNIPTCEWMI